MGMAMKALGPDRGYTPSVMGVQRVSGGGILQAHVLQVQRLDQDIDLPTKMRALRASSPLNINDDAWSERKGCGVFLELIHFAAEPLARRRILLR